jgi:hypothetical protein
MTQATQQQLIDYVDLCLSHGHIPVNGPQPDNTESRQEWEFIRLALEAIRCDALAAQIRAVRLSRKSPELAN